MTVERVKPKQISLYMDETGVLSLTKGTTQVFQFNVTPLIFLGESTSLEVTFTPYRANPTKPSDFKAIIRIVDTLTDDEIVNVQGLIVADDEVITGLPFTTYSTQFFENNSISLELSGTNDAVVKAIQASSAFKPLNTYKTVKAVLALPTDAMPEFNIDTTSNILNSLPRKPSDLGITGFGSDDMPIETLSIILNSAYQLNIPITIELEPTLSPLDGVGLVTSLAVNNFQVVFIHSPNECRPVGSLSVRGKKIPFNALGQYFAHKQKRNLHVDANGLPPLATPISGEDFPFTGKALSVRDDVEYGEEILEKLAIAKINVVRPIDYTSGTRFVLSDVLTTKISDDSALRLVNSAECAMFTTNQINKILLSNLLRRKSDYLTKSTREITKFLNSCATAGIVMPAEDLDYRPYAFALYPDPIKPYERVKFSFNRGLDGCTRSVSFEDDVVNR